MTDREEQKTNWLILIDKHTESGMNPSAFFLEHGIKAQRLYIVAAPFNP